MNKKDFLHEDVIIEAKADQERFKNWIGLDKINGKTVGEIYFDKFQKFKQRLKPPYNDLYHWITNSTPDQFKTYMDDLETEVANKELVKSKEKDGARLVYKDDNWKVYEITTYEASAKYGKNTKWCISGSKEWTSPNQGGQQFFDGYYNQNGIRFYFFINNKDEKWALAVYPNNEYCEIFNAEDVKVAYIPNAPEIPEIKVKYNDNSDSNILVNAIMSGQLNEKLLIDLMADVIIENTGEMCSIFNRPDDMVYFVEEYIPEGYLEYEAVESGAMTPEEYEEITGEVYIEGGWGGDIPAIDLDDIGSFDTKDEYLDRTIYEAHKYWVCFETGSGYGYEVYNADDWVHLYLLGNDLCRFQDWPDEDVADFYDNQNGGSRADMLGVCMANLLIDKIKKGEISKGDIENIGLSQEYLASLGESLKESEWNPDTINAREKENQDRIDALTEQDVLDWCKRDKVATGFAENGPSIIFTSGEVYNFDKYKYHMKGLLNLFKGKGGYRYGPSEPGDWNVMEQVLNKCEKEFGIVTTNLGRMPGLESRCKVVALKKPTERQYEKITDFLDAACMKKKQVIIYLGDKGQQTYYFINDTSDDIIKKIKKAYAFGRLEESREEFFKNSIVRDASGNLLPVYHCSFSEFDTFAIDDEDGSLEGSDWSGEFGFAWFAEDENYAQNYGDGEEYECYLNITNPLDIGELNNDVEVDDGVEIKDDFYDEGVAKVSHEFIRLCKLVKVQPEDMIKWYHKWWETGCLYDLTRRAFFKNLVVKMGYDGVIATEGGNKTWGCVRANQIKLISNENPTEKDSMKEELKNGKIVGYRYEMDPAHKTDLRSVIEFETLELDNQDILATVKENFAMDADELRKVKLVLKDWDSAEESEKQEAIDACISAINRKYPEAKYCLWLCNSKEDVYNNYIAPFEGGDEPMDSYDYDEYEIEFDTPISNLGDEGYLYLFSKAPKAVNEDLSKEQEDFFKDSVIRRHGKLIPMWHGTDVEFKEFNKPINWFSTSRKYAEEFATWLGNEPVLYEAYLNCKKPFKCGNTSEPIFDINPLNKGQLSPVALDLAKRLGVDEDDIKRLVSHTSAETDSEKYKLKLHTITRLSEFAELVKSKGYDSIITLEGGHPCVGVFNPEDIKRVSNLKPTSSKDIDEEIFPYKDTGIQPNFTQEDIRRYANEEGGCEFGLSEGASVVLSDGTTINVSDFETHGMFAGCVYAWTADLSELGADENGEPIEPDWDGDADEDAIEYMYSLGVVTLNSSGWLEDRRKIVFEGRPTEAQFEVMREFIDMVQETSKVSDELYVFSGTKLEKYLLNGETSDDIIKDIKRSLISENLKEKNYPQPKKLYNLDKETAYWPDDAEDWIYWKSEADKWAEDYAKSYKVKMSPKDYLDLTTEKGADSLKVGDYVGLGQLRDLDVDEFNKETYQNIFLQAAFRDTNNPNKAQVTGHEGRHRMFALMQAGVKSVDVEIICDVWDTEYNKYKPFELDHIDLVGQFNKNVVVTVNNPIPMSWKQHKSIRPNLKDESLKNIRDIDNDYEDAFYTSSPKELLDFLKKERFARFVWFNEEPEMYLVSYNHIHQDMGKIGRWLLGCNSTEYAFIFNLGNLEDIQNCLEFDDGLIYIYKDFCIFDRDEVFEETSLYKYLGKPSDIVRFNDLDESKESNDLTISVYTYQSPEVKEILDSGKAYTAEYGRGMFSDYDTDGPEVKNPYRELARVLGLKNCPVFGALDQDDLWNMIVASGLETSDRTQLLHLEVPAKEVHKTFYYDWTDYINALEEPEEFEAQSGMTIKQLEDELRKNDGGELCQVVLDRIEPEWVVDSKDVTAKNPFSKEEIEKDLDDIHNWIASGESDKNEELTEKIHNILPDDEDGENYGGWWTDSAYELKKFIDNNVVHGGFSTIKIVYFPREGIWTFGDAWDIIHTDLIDSAIRTGLVNKKSEEERYLLYTSGSDEEEIDYRNVDIKIYDYGSFDIADLGWPFDNTPLYQALGKPKDIREVNFYYPESLQEKIVQLNNGKWQVQENLDTFDDLSFLCKKLSKKHNAFGGNCGHFALALARELVKQGFDENNFGITICSSIYNEDLGDYNYSPRAYEETESDIYHVAINFGNALFDGSGRTSISNLKKIAKEEYDDDNPNIYSHTYTKENDDDFRYAFEWGTNYDVYPEYYQELLQKEFKTLVEKIVKKDLDIPFKDIGLDSDYEIIDDDSYNSKWHYFGDCISTVDGNYPDEDDEEYWDYYGPDGADEDAPYWDATEMAQALEKAKIYLGKKKLIDAPKEALSKNVVCGVIEDRDIGFIYNIDNDIHYFFDISSSLVEKIVKKGSKYQVQSEKGRNLGTYDTKQEAEKRLQQVHYFKHMDESLDEFDSIVKTELDTLNRWLDKHGFEVELIEDYDFEEYPHTVGMFLNTQQDNASVFPVALNKEYILDYCKDDKEELVYAIRGTLWHEAGHGIYRFLEDIMDMPEDEEDCVEEFARYRENSELFDILQGYMKQDESLKEEVDDKDVYYRGYDSRYGVFDSNNKYAQLYTWVTDEIAYAYEYAKENKYGKIAKVRITCSDKEIGSTWDLPEDSDYYDPGDEDFKECILDQGLKGYGFEAGDYDDYCVCISKDCVEVIDPDVEIEVEEESLKEEVSLLNDDREKGTRIVDNLSELVSILNNMPNGEAKIIYDFEKDWYIIGNPYNVTHRDMIRQAIDDVYYDTEEFLDDVEMGENLVDLVMDQVCSIYISKDNEESDESYTYMYELNIDGTTWYAWSWNRASDVDLISNYLVRENLNESKADQQKFIDKFGEQRWNLFNTLKTRLINKDIYYWLKKTEDELDDELRRVASQKTNKEVRNDAKAGATLLAEDENWKLYKIDTYEASKYYGYGTQWCISCAENACNIFDGIIADDEEDAIQQLKDSQPVVDIISIGCDREYKEGGGEYTIEAELEPNYYFDAYYADSDIFFFIAKPENKECFESEEWCKVAYVPPYFYSADDNDFRGGDTNLPQSLVNFYNQHKNLFLGLPESLIESKQDIEKFRQWCGDELADRFFAVKNRLKGELKDIYYWISLENKLGPNKELAHQTALDSLEYAITDVEVTPTKKERQELAKNGSEKIYEDERWLVLKINSFEASVKYGKHTQWCITGTNSGMDGGRSDWNYHSGNDMYFFIDKQKDTKYALEFKDMHNWCLYNDQDYVEVGEGDIAQEAVNVLGDPWSTEYDTHYPAFPKLDGLPDLQQAYKDVIAEEGADEKSIKVESLNEDLNVLDALDKEFGQEEVYMWSTYILPSGHFLNPDNSTYFEDNDVELAYEHCDFEDWAYQKGYNLSDIYNNCIKMNVTFPYLSMPDKARPTPEQMRAVKSIIEKNAFQSEGKFLFYDAFDKNKLDKMGRNLLAIYTPKGDEVFDLDVSDADDIVRAINQAYIRGGFFTESLNESKADWEKFRQWCNDDELYNRFINVQKRLEGKYRDIYYWMGLEKKYGKHGAIQELQAELRNIEETPTAKEKAQLAKEGTTMLYNANGWKVFEINTYEASRKYGKGTNWCISGDDMGYDYFGDYHDSGDRIIFFIKDDDTKYAVVIDGNYWTIYDGFDNIVSHIPGAPKVDGVPDVSKIKDDAIRAIVQLYNVSPSDIEDVKSVFDDSEMMDFFWDYDTREAYAVTLKSNETKFMYFDGPQAKYVDVTDEFLKWAEEYL